MSNNYHTTTLIGSGGITAANIQSSNSVYMEEYAAPNRPYIAIIRLHTNNGAIRDITFNFKLTWNNPSQDDLFRRVLDELEGSNLTDRVTNTVYYLENIEKAEVVSVNSNFQHQLEEIINEE